jgi:hypothetical protein
MKKISLIGFGMLILTSCQDKTIQNENDLIDMYSETLEPGMQRVIASSPEEIKLLISQLSSSSTNRSRAISSANMSNSEEPFVSLVEANRKKVMESLTPAQLDSILNDEDDLEFSPADSVIADIQFAQLLNADREIQVGETVYKYVSNGVAYTNVVNAAELKTIETITSDIKVTPENEGITLKVSKNVEFKPIQYQLIAFKDNALTAGNITSSNLTTPSDSNTTSSDNNNTTATSTSSSIYLSNGVVIPQTDIRDVNYKEKGDGNWVHRVWTGIWGRNVVACKNFKKNYKLNLNFYDQNYIIYANIGTKLKMQKKVCGIWWNIKADELVQGWETVSIKYTMPEPIISKFTNPLNNQNEYPSHAWNPFPYGEDNILLLHIPFINYDFTTNDLNKAFNAGLKLAWNNTTKAVKNLINNDSTKAGLMTFNDNDAYIIYGPYSESYKNKKSIENKFYAKWVPGTYEFGFSLGTTIKLAKITFSGNDGVELYRGRVFGAIKYKGKWLAARITKDK